MGAISSEIVHLLKVKLSLQNDQRWLLLLSWYSKFSGGGPTYPPFQISKYVIYFQFNTTQNKPLVKNEVFNSGVSNKRRFLLIVINGQYIY